MTTSTYTVVGMTCSHCVAAVTEEVGQIPGVSDIDVDLGTGGVSITSDRELRSDMVRDAVEEAGYELAGSA